MNYEILFWLQPVSQTIYGFSILSFIVASTVSIIFSILIALDKTNLDYKPATIESFKRWTKKSIIVIIVSAFTTIISAQINKFPETYKNILIYRGINSIIVDKSIQTADKALNLLNTKIDKELKELNIVEKDK